MTDESADLLEREVDGTVLPFGPKASELSVEHHREGHPEPVEMEYAAKCPLCYAAQQADEEPTEEGARYAFSPVSGVWYHVTEWEDKGDGKIVAHEKDEVDRSEVPQKWLDAVDEEVL